MMDQNSYCSPESLAEPSNEPAPLTRLGWILRLSLLVISTMALGLVWLIPVAGFHHTYIVGIFGWLVINGENPNPNSVLYFHGEEYVPTPWGLPLNVVATCGIFWLLSHVFWRRKRLPSPAQGVTASTR